MDARASGPRFANHQNSKKHKENVAFLKEQMAEEEEETVDEKEDGDLELDEPLDDAGDLLEGSDDNNQAVGMQGTNEPKRNK